MFSVGICGSGERVEGSGNLNHVDFLLQNSFQSEIHRFMAKVARCKTRARLVELYVMSPIVLASGPARWSAWV